MSLSTHVLDQDAGVGAVGLTVRAEQHRGDGWALVASAVTDESGRVSALVEDTAWGPGRWRLVFETGAWFGAGAFWPEITVEIDVADPGHHHVPLLLARHAYTTYRGS